MSMIAYNATRAAAIATEVEKADTSASRNKGLLGRSSMAAQEGLWIVPCPMIHTFFMKFSIDVLFFDSTMRVVRVIENLRPWRLSPWVLSARSVLELKGGVLKGSVKAGDHFEMRAA